MSNSEVNENTNNIIKCIIRGILKKKLKNVLTYEEINYILNQSNTNKSYL